MVLGNQVEWALHCCSVLAVQPEGTYLSTKDLAEFHGVPKEYLSKALQALSQAGLIQANLGPRGGYCLAKDPKQINFLDIVEALEGRRRTFLCTEIRNNNPCLKKKDSSSSVCSIAKVMYKADEAWRQELRSVLLSDLVKEVDRILPRTLKQDMADWFKE